MPNPSMQDASVSNPSMQDASVSNPSMQDASVSNPSMPNANTKHVLRISKEQLLHTLVPMVMRQTDYSADTAEAKLIEHKFDLKKVLYEWMGVEIKKEEVSCSTGSQERYRVIRQTMDEAGKKFRNSNR